MPTGGVVLSGWTFTVNGSSVGNPVFLSLEVGVGYSTGNLAVWHFDGAAWTAYAAGDLAYDGRYANVTVMGFSGYAVTAVVPEPGALALVALGGMGLLVRRRRRHAKAWTPNAPNGRHDLL